MNKLVVDNSIDYNDIFIDKDTDLVVDLSDTSKELNVHVITGINVKGFIKTKNTNNKINYFIDDNANVIINKLAIDTSDDITINLNDSNSFIKYNSSIINYDNNIYTQKIKHIKSDTNSKIVNHCINVEDKEFKFIVDGIINRDAKRVDFNQDNKIINLKNGKSSILPNLIVDNDDIEASHSAYIGTFDEDKKFYMMSRGLTSKECDDLLIKAFLINDMQLDDKEKDIFLSIIESINK